MFSSKRKLIDSDIAPKTPKATSQQLESKSVLHVEKPDENFHTPKVTRKKGNLYKLTIIQNASKFTPEKGQPHTTTSVRSEEFKRDFDAKINEATKEKEETKSAIIKHVNSSQLLTEKSKIDSTFAVKNLVFGPKVDDKIFKKHLMLIMRGLNYSLKLLKPPPMSYIQTRQIMLKELKSN